MSCNLNRDIVFLMWDALSTFYHTVILWRISINCYVLSYLITSTLHLLYISSASIIFRQALNLQHKCWLSYQSTYMCCIHFQTRGIQHSCTYMDNKILWLSCDPYMTKVMKHLVYTSSKNPGEKICIVHCMHLKTFA